MFKRVWGYDVIFCHPVRVFSVTRWTIHRAYFYFIFFTHKWGEVTEQTRGWRGAGERGRRVGVREKREGEKDRGMYTLNLACCSYVLPY